MPGWGKNKKLLGIHLSNDMPLIFYFRSKKSL